MIKQETIETVLLLNASSTGFISIFGLIGVYKSICLVIMISSILITAESVWFIALTLFFPSLWFLSFIIFLNSTVGFLYTHHLRKYQLEVKSRHNHFTTSLLSNNMTECQSSAPPKYEPPLHYNDVVYLTQFYNNNNDE